VNVQHGYTQVGGNQNIVAATEISDDEYGEKKKQSSIACRKRKVGSDDKQQSKALISNGSGDEGADESEQEIAGNIEAPREKSKPGRSAVGGGEP
jgi:hypothetical protein